MYDIRIRQDDTKPAVRGQLLKDRNTPVDLSSISGVKFKVFDTSGALAIDKAATVKDAANGDVEYTWDAEDTDTPGDYRAYFEVTFSDGSILTVPNTRYRTMRIYPEN